MFSRIKSVLIDLSGTLHIESSEVPGSIEALKRLKSSNLKYLFVTNTTKESQNVLYSRLTKLGFDIEKEKIFTSLLAAVDFIKREQVRPHLMLEDAALEDFQDVLTTTSNDSKGEAVVVGLAPSHFNYDAMNVAFAKLLSGARLVAIHQGRYFQTQKGLSLGPGPFVKALAYAADIKPESVVVVGKPSRDFFLSALKALDPSLLPEEAVMIGDDVRDDVAGAMATGMQAILVRTGKYRSGDEGKISPAPSLTAATFSDAINAILLAK